MRNNIPALFLGLIAAFTLVACSEDSEQTATGAGGDNDRAAASSQPAGPAYNAPTVDDIRSVLMREYIRYIGHANIKDADTVFVKSPVPQGMSPLVKQILTVDITRIGVDNNYRVDLRGCKPAEGKEGYLCEFDTHLAVVPNDEMRDMSRRMSAQFGGNPLLAAAFAPLLEHYQNMSGDGERYCTIHREHFLQTPSGWHSPSRHTYYQELAEYDRQASLYSEAESRCSTFEATKDINRSYCGVGGWGYKILTNGRPTPPPQTSCEWQPGPANNVMASAATAKPGQTSAPSAQQSAPRQVEIQPPPPEDPYKDAPRLPLAHTRYYAVAYAKLTGQDDDAFYEGLINTLIKGQAPGYVAETIKMEREALAPLRRNFSPGQKVWVKGKLGLFPRYDETSGALPVSGLGFGPQHTGTRCAYNRLIYQKLEKQVDSIKVSREQADLLLTKNWLYNGSFNARFLVSAVGTGKAPYNLNPRPVGALKFRIHKIEIVPANVDADIDEPGIVLASYEPDTSGLPPVQVQKAKQQAPVKATVAENAFDIRGLRLGMPMTDAEQQVRKFMDVGFYLKTNPVTTRPGAYTDVRVFIDKDKSEFIVLFEPYGGGDTLAGVVRHQRLAQGVMGAAISGQLLEKYGAAQQVQTSATTGSLRWGKTADNVTCQSDHNRFGTSLPGVTLVENHTGEHEYKALTSLSQVGTIFIFNFQEKDAEKWSDCGNVLEAEWNVSNQPWLKQSLVNHGSYFRRLLQANKENKSRPVKLKL